MVCNSIEWTICKRTVRCDSIYKMVLHKLHYLNTFRYHQSSDLICPFTEKPFILHRFGIWSRGVKIARIYSRVLRHGNQDEQCGQFNWMTHHMSLGRGRLRKPPKGHYTHMWKGILM